MLFCSTPGCPGWVWSSRRAQTCKYCSVRFPSPYPTPPVLKGTGKGKGKGGKGGGKGGQGVHLPYAPGQYQAHPPVWTQSVPAHWSYCPPAYQHPVQYAQHYPPLPGSQGTGQLATRGAALAAASPKAKAKAKSQPRAANPHSAGEKPGNGEKESAELILARREVALYKELLPPGHHKLVRAQESYRQARFAGLQAKEPSKQVQSLQDQLASHAAKVEHLLDEAAWLEAEVESHATRHAAVTLEIKDLDSEIGTLEVQLEVARKAATAEQLARGSGTTGKSATPLVKSAVEKVGADLKQHIDFMAQRIQASHASIPPEAIRFLEETFSELGKVAATVSSPESQDRYTRSVLPTSDASPGQLEGIPEEGAEEPFIEGAGRPPYDAEGGRDSQAGDEMAFFNEEFDELDDDLADPAPPAKHARKQSASASPGEDNPVDLSQEPPTEEIARSCRRLLSCVQAVAKNADDLETISRRRKSGAQGGGTRTGPYPPGHISKPSQDEDL